MDSKNLLPGVTPELLTWLASQKRAGFETVVIHQALREAGWDDAVARALLDLPAQDPREQDPRELEHQDAGELPPPLPVPWPPTLAQHLVMPAGDRSVRALVVMREPDLLVLDGLLSDEECQALMAAAQPRLARSLTVAVKTGGEEENADRTSQGMFFERGETELIARIEARIASLLNWPVENGEGLQILRYAPGAQYKPHYDYFDPAEPGTASILTRGGQRVATVVMYLNEPEAGGGTVFPEVQLECLPKRGNAVFFSYSRPHPSSRSLHGGSPVLAGEKWIATKWLREREFI